MSRAPRPFTVLGFESTHDALAAEQVIKDADLAVVPIPSPPSLGALCGIALRVPRAAAEQALSLIREHDIEPSAVILMDDV